MLTLWSRHFSELCKFSVLLGLCFCIFDLETLTGALYGSVPFLRSAFEGQPDVEHRVSDKFQVSFSKQCRRAARDTMFKQGHLHFHCLMENH